MKYECVRCGEEIIFKTYVRWNEESEEFVVYEPWAWAKIPGDSWCTKCGTESSYIREEE